MPFSILTTFILSFWLLLFFRKVAKKIDLVDKPSARKHHQGAIPLIGGVSIYFAMFISSLIFGERAFEEGLFYGCGAVLIVIGVLDDKFDISFKVRLLVQAGIALTMIFVADCSLENLGSIVGNLPISLPNWVAYSMTIIAVVGAINAFNMVDGIDGLLGGLACVSFGALGIMFMLEGNASLAQLCAIFIAALIPYILLNLGIPFGPRYKIFMGDAGSMLIGFSVVWLLIRASQNANTEIIRPVTALWFIALPLMDMASIMVRRMRKGHSPFKPDREHLHHICQRIGLSPAMTLLFICSLAALFAAMGIFGEIFNVSEKRMFVAFMSLFGVYFFTLNHIFRITAAIRRRLGKPPLEEEPPLHHPVTTQTAK